jgi:hypothetical protein
MFLSSFSVQIRSVSQKSGIICSWNTVRGAFGDVESKKIRMRTL